MVGLRELVVAGLFRWVSVTCSALWVLEWLVVTMLIVSFYVLGFWVAYWYILLLVGGGF